MGVCVYMSAHAYLYMCECVSVYISHSSLSREWAMSILVTVCANTYTVVNILPGSGFDFMFMEFTN